MQQFHCVVLSKQSLDLSTGQGERASVELHIAAGHLRDTVGLSSKVVGDNERFTRFTSLTACFITCSAFFPSGRFELNNSQTRLKMICAP